MDNAEGKKTVPIPMALHKAKPSFAAFLPGKNFFLTDAAYVEP